MKQSFRCIPHAEATIRAAFVGQNILIETKLDNHVTPCQYKNLKVADKQCQRVAAVKVTIFEPGEPIRKIGTT